MRIAGRSAAGVVLLACALAPGRAGAQRVDPDTRLLPGDRVVLQVKNEPALSGPFTVTPEGTILLPLIGLVRVADRPFAEFEADVRSIFARELAEPEMVLTPFRRITILGEVRLPGYQWFEPDATVADALVLAGGFLPTAKRKHLLLLRAGVETRVGLEPDGIAATTPLRSGDRIVIERRSWLSENLAIFVGAAASVAAAAATSLIVR
jgi:polysaccharide export outer membrane protein